MCVFCFGVTSLAKERTVATVIRRRWFIEVSTSPRSQTLLVSSWTPPQFELSLRSVCVCVCVGERESTPLSPCLLLSASESGTRRKRPIIKNPSLHLCSVGINHFFAFLFSFFPLLWLSDIPHPFPPSPKPPLTLTHTCNLTLLAQASFFFSLSLFTLQATVPKVLK